MEEPCFGIGAAKPDVSDEGEEGISVITAWSGVTVQEAIRVTFFIFLFNFNHYNDSLGSCLVQLITSCHV